MDISSLRRGLFIAFLLLVIPATVATAKTDAVNSCVQCHSKLDDSRLLQPYQKWQKSIHAEVGNTCDGCHGGNPQDQTLEAMSAKNNFLPPPKSDASVAFCGKCHPDVSQNFENSSHGMMGEPVCVDCHGSHTIRRFSTDIIRTEKCTDCHDYESPEKLKNILQELHGTFQSTNHNLKKVKGFPTKNLKTALKKAGKEIRQVRVITHTFDLDQVTEGAEKVKALLGNSEKEIEVLIDRGEKRKIWGTVTVGLFLILFVLTYFYNKENNEDE